jgi:release factor glutamine methyltransferase
MKTPSNSVRDCRRYYAGELEKLYGSDEANALIMILLEHYFNIDKIKIALEPDLRLSESELLTLHFAVKELLKNRPIQYIIGETEFCGMRFFVNENVLIPRPETEELVNQLISCSVNQLTVNPHPSFRPDIERREMVAEKSPANISILDIGTGSGCIAISLAKLLKDSDVTAVDISEKALEVARKNAEANGVNVRFVHDDILNPHVKTYGRASQQFDIIVSNPPYVCESEKSDMRANVLDYEPSTALFVSDNDPLVFYRKILEFAQKTLKPNGAVWFEINEKFGKEMKDLCLEKGFKNVEIIKDFREKERVVRAQRQSF